MSSIFKGLLKRVLSSVKFHTFVLGIVASVVVRVLHLGQDQAAQIADGIIKIVMAFLVGQGLADFGKEAVKLQNNDNQQ